MLLLFPRIQVGPLFGLAFWSFIGFLIIGLIGGITWLGTIVFAAIFAIGLLLAWIILKRIVNRVLGRRAGGRR